MVPEGDPITGHHVAPKNKNTSAVCLLVVLAHPRHDVLCNSRPADMEDRKADFIKSSHYPEIEHPMGV